MINMKTLSEIISICKDGGKPTIDEARLAICVMDALITFDSMYHTRRVAREKAGENPDLFTATHDYEERFNRIKTALNKTPIEWLGDSDNPDNEEVQKRRKILNKFAIDIFEIGMKPKQW
jgi:hypothetical protein